MKIIETPVFNDDGSIKFVAQVNPEQAQALLQFAYNFLVATGMTVRTLINNQNEENLTPPDNTQLN